MTPVSIAVFIMMLIAAGFGFAIAWVFKSGKIESFLEDYKSKVKLANRLQEEQESLVKHANNLQSDTLKISQKNEKQSKRIQSLKDIVQQLEHDKEFIFKEYEQFRQEVKTKLSKSQKLFEAYEDVKEKNQRLKIKADKWKIRFHETEQKLQETEAAYLKVNKDKEQILDKLSTPGTSTESMLKWEKNYKELKLKFLALTKEKTDLEKEIAHTDSGKNKQLDSMISKLSEEIVILKKENKTLQYQLSEKSVESKPAKDRESILARIKSRSKQVDFTRIGKGNARSKDDLKKLKGLGTLIDQKFQAIGINTFAQIANLNAYDQKLLNFFLELPQGKIESEKWVSQAKMKLGRTEDKKETLARVSSNIQKIDFDRIGEASPSQKDSLQSIVGIGPFIEKKLNAIGIFRLEQLARLSEADIEEINSIIELAPGHIQNDDWVGQARRMK